MIDKLAFEPKLPIVKFMVRNNGNKSTRFSIYFKNKNKRDYIFYKVKLNAKGAFFFTEGFVLHEPLYYEGNKNIVVKVIALN